MDNQPIRIAHIIGKMMNGGVEAVVFNYYRNIDKNKFQFDFFYDADSTVQPSLELIEMGAKFYQIPPYQRIISYERELIKLFKLNKYKIVHSHMNTLSIFSLRAAKRAGVPIRIAHNHSTAGKGETKKNIMKYMLRPFAKIYPTH
ncbi:MAG: glycosyltransferase, partial [Bacilli bacterium]